MVRSIRLNLTRIGNLAIAAFFCMSIFPINLLFADSWASLYQGEDKVLISQVLADLRVIESSYLNCSYEFESTVAEGEKISRQRSGVIWVREHDRKVSDLYGKCWLRAELKAKDQTLPHRFEIVRNDFTMVGHLVEDVDGKRIGIVDGVDVVSQSNGIFQMDECFPCIRHSGGPNTYADHLDLDVKGRIPSDARLETVSETRVRISVQFLETEDDFYSGQSWTLDYEIERINGYWCVVRATQRYQYESAGKLSQNEIAKEITYLAGEQKVPALSQVLQTKGNYQIKTEILRLDLMTPAPSEFDPLVYGIEFAPQRKTPTMIVILAILLAIVLAVVMLNRRTEKKHGASN